MIVIDIKSIIFHYNYCLSFIKFSFFELSNIFLLILTIFSPGKFYNRFFICQTDARIKKKIRFFFFWKKLKIRKKNCDLFEKVSKTAFLDIFGVKVS